MTEPADHLIERAAALLRAANVARLPDQSRTGAAAPAPAAAGPVAKPAVSFPPVGPSPLLVPPTRPTPIQPGVPQQAVRSMPPVAPVPLRTELAGASHVVDALRLAELGARRHGLAGDLPPDPANPVNATPVMAPPVVGAASSDIGASQPTIALDTLERAGLVVARSKRTRISEEYRIVIGRVLRALHEEVGERPQASPVAQNVVLVTSARPGEGKSFSALNLAGSIAQNAGERVLLIDVDPKIRPMSDQLGLGERKGFLDLVVEPGLSLDELILPTALPNLSILPLGSRPGSRAAGLADDGTTLRPITPTIHMLARHYSKSLIVLDAPPCLSTSDSHTLAGHVGQVVMVVEAERTQRSEVEAALDLVRVCPTITMLLNKVRLTTSHTFGAYDYFGTYT